jgi:hypothetical protein
MDEYAKGPIHDALWAVASALDMTIRQCLGDPLDQSLVISTIEKNVWNSTLRLSGALGAQPIKLQFDDRAHRVLPMALGNLVRRKWHVAGVYDPSAKQFIERSAIIQWPKTGSVAPHDWLSCDAGKMISAASAILPECAECPEGTFSLGGQATVCSHCSPGTSFRQCRLVVF